MKQYLPGIVLGCLGASLLEVQLTELLYSLRGLREPSAELLVVSVESGYTPDEVLERLSLPEQMRCFNLHPVAVEKSDCINVPLDNRPFESTYHSLFDFFRHDLGLEESVRLESIQPWYYGPLMVFGPVPSTTAMAAEYRVDENKKILVLVPNEEQHGVPVLTAMGSFQPYELALNILSNVKEDNYLHRSSAPMLVVAVILTVFLSAWIFAQYPIMLALFLVLLSVLFLFIISLLSFDYFHWLMPFVGMVSGVLVTVISVMVYRLNISQKGEWNLERDKENLLRLEEMRTNFLSLVSHDLKTPIARMQSMLEQFMRGDFGALNGEQQKSLTRVLSANGYLQRTISSFFLLNRVESGNFSLKSEPTDLVELINGVIAQLQMQIQERKIELRCEFEPLFLIELDRALIKEVAVNLLDNAIKYSPVGSKIEISCGESENCADLLPSQPGVWFEVRDFGPGIPLEDRARIAQKFFRGSQEVTEGKQASKGTGIGLFLSAFFVEKHGGHFSFFSKCQNETTKDSAPESRYFSATESGTVMRVALPVESERNLT